ncbi:MAG TPA: type II secretion system F family protein [Ilumatobacter sp.]|nr:type II secretion system F family protein [Ilumatobacter sp.]
MSPLTIVILSGGFVGAGVWLAWSGWSPARPPLAQTLARLGQPLVEIAPERDNLDVRIGTWARGLGPVERILATLRTDLRVLRRSPDEQAARLLLYTLCGLLWGPFVSGGLWALGIPVPFAVPLWLALAGAVIGGVASIRPLRTQAQQRRRTFSVALGSFCDVCGMCLASGRGIDASIQTAAAAGSGWPFVELNTALRTGYMRGWTPWQALEQLAEECDFADLAELAAALSLAGDEGAAVRDTVASKARSIRERLTSSAERDAASVTERMAVPATFLLFGFVIFIGYPAIYVLFEQ